MNPAKLVVIVNSFNRLNLLKQALASLILALEKLPFASAIVVFEAGSTDGSIEWLGQFKDNLDKQGRPREIISLELVIADRDNDTSFSAGVNKAVSRSCQIFPQFEYLLFYETDNYLKSESPLLKAKELIDSRKELAGCGFTVKKHDGTDAGAGCPFPSVGSFLIGPQLSLILGVENSHEALRDFADTKFMYSDVVFTSPLLLKREPFEQAKGFDAEVFPFSDCDVDFAYRLRKLGWRLAVLQSDEVIHDNQQELSGWSSKRAIHFHQARLKLLKRQLGPGVNLIKPLLLFRHFLEVCLLCLLVPFGANRKDQLQTRLSLLKTVMHNYSTPV